MQHTSQNTVIPPKGVRGTDVVLRDGTQGMTDDWDIGDHELTVQTLVIDVADGTAPMTVTSTTLVTNLNADRLDGEEGSHYLDLTNATGTLAVDRGGLGTDVSGIMVGGLIVGTSGGTEILVAGSAGDVLTVQADGTLAWEAPTGGTLDLDDLGDVTAGTPAAGDVLYYDGADWANADLATAGIAAATHATEHESGGADEIDHDLMAGLTDGDGHTQYALLAGRSGGQTLSGGTDVGDNLTIDSTADATKGDVLIQPGGGRVLVGISVAPISGRLLTLIGENGQIVAATNATASVNKSSLIQTLAYDNRSVTAFLTSCTSTANNVFYGGGTGGGDAATNIYFFTAAAVGTTTGTARMNVSSGGLVGIGVGTSVASGQLQVKSGATTTKTLVAQAAASQTVSVLECQNSTGTALVTVGPSGRLTIADSAATPPLSLTERSSAPSAPAAGDIYLDDGTNTASGGPGFRRYTGSAWEDVGGGGGSSLPYRWQLSFDAGELVLPGGGATTGTLQNRTYLSFDDTTAETADTPQFAWPHNYGGGAVTLVLYYMMASASSGTTVWTAEVEAVTPGDTTNISAGSSFDTANNSSASTVPSPAGKMTSVTITLTNKDSVAAGDLARIRVGRLPTDASDDATGDARLLCVTIYEAD